MGCQYRQHRSCLSLPRTLAAPASGGTPLTNDRITVGKSRLLGDGTGVRFAIQELLSPGRAKAEIDGGVRLSVWSETQSSAFASEVLSPEEEQRLQALGYLR